MVLIYFNTWSPVDRDIWGGIRRFTFSKGSTSFGVSFESEKKSNITSNLPFLLCTHDRDVSSHLTAPVTVAIHSATMMHSYPSGTVSEN